MRSVLAVEDDPNLQELLSIHLSDLDCSLDKAFDGDSGWRKIERQAYDLIILDIMLPGLDGLEICRRIRAKNLKTPVLMLTAKSEEIDKVLGLEMGADDYLTKPFSIREFIARVKALFRRVERLAGGNVRPASGVYYQFGALELDLEKRKVMIDKQRVDLSPKEYELLVLLATHPGKSYDRNRILNLIWGYDFEGYEHTVNSHINRLRGKIEPDISNPSYILTTWGVGYRFNEDLA